jgi:hypothetical protein
MRKWTRRGGGLAVGLGLLLLTLGCGSPPIPPPSADTQAAVKVEAIKRLADQMAKDPNGVEARGALEEFRNTPLDPQKNPQQADEIVQVYRQRIQGKYKGFVYQELQQEMGQFLAATKHGK